MIISRAKCWVLVGEIIGMFFLSPLFAQEQNEEDEQVYINSSEEENAVSAKESEEEDEYQEESPTIDEDFESSESYKESAFLTDEESPVAVDSKEEKVLPVPTIKKTTNKKPSQDLQAENDEISLLEVKKKQKAEITKPKFKKGDRPTLEKGTIFLSGSLSAGYKLRQFDYPEHSFSIYSNISAGYFIKDRFALGLGVPASIKLKYGLRSGRVGLSAFSTYFFDVNKIFYPYIGADVTARFNIAPRTILLSAGLEAGLLLGLNERVALDFSISPEIYFPLSDKQKWELELPLSFVGIRAFF